MMKLLPLYGSLKVTEEDERNLPNIFIVFLCQDNLLNGSTHSGDWESRSRAL